MGDPGMVEAQLASFAAELTFEDIPADTLAHVKNLVIDAVGCALTGERSPEVASVEAAAASTFGAGDSSVIASGDRTSAAAATMRNAYLITAMTVCDVYRPAHCHVTPLALPPALAVGEQLGSSGRDLLTAATLGMETITRLGLGLDYPAFRARGWHSPGVIGPFGAAAAAGRLHGFDEEQMTHAFGLAATQAGGSYLSWGTPAVKFHQARGAVSGLLATNMALAGFIGGRQPLTAPDGGIFHTHSNGGDPEAVVAELGRRWELEQVAIRLWPGASPVQAMLTALLDVMQQEQASARDVEHVEIAISSEDQGTHGGFAHPQGTFEALLSYRFLCSVVLHDGRMWFEQVSAERCRDPAVLSFADERIEVTGRDDIPLNGCMLRLSLQGGREVTRTVEYARGTPQNPADDDEVRQKFHRCVDPRIGEQGGEQVLDMLSKLESLDDVGELCRRLRLDAAAN